MVLHTLHFTHADGYNTQIDGMGDADEEQKLDGLQQIISNSTSVANTAAAVAAAAAAVDASKSPDETSV